MDEPREIDWSTAVVEDARLSVELTGEPSRDWGDHMHGVLVRLDARWSERIKVAKRRIRVTGVDGDEAEELRHLLEAAAQQTNADLIGPPAGDPGQATGGQAADDGDGALTDAFRAFAATAATAANDAADAAGA